MKPAFVLIHSPLVGPLTWSSVARELRQRGIDAIVPDLADDGATDRPFWQQHAKSVTETLASIPPDRPVALVGHSGAGPLLPAIGERIGRPVAAYLFVDAGIPADGASRLDLMADEDPAFARHFREHLNSGGRFPTWTGDDLAPILADPRLRRQVIADLRPRARPFFTEPIPVYAGWPDAPCAYVKFSAPYDVPARQARTAGWPTREIDAGHFHMLVDPPAVAAALLDLADQAVGEHERRNHGRP